MTVKDLIKELGGGVVVTKALKLKYPSIVQGWIERNRIPSWRIDAVKKLLKAKNIDLKKINDIQEQTGG